MNHPQLSVQLYTVEKAFESDPAGTLARIKAMGFSQVEPYNFMDFGDLGETLRASGLTAPTAHGRFVGMTDAELNVVFASAKRWQIDRVIDPYVPPERWQHAGSVSEIAAQLNAAAVIAATHGVTIGYHNHAHELRSVIGSRPALELLAEELSPEIGLEVDTFWAEAGGQDAVGLLGRLGTRVVAIHVKDGATTLDVKDQTAVGAGSLPIRQILDAAPQALRVIELDDTVGDRFQAIADSFDYLVGEGLA